MMRNFYFGISGYFIIVIGFFFIVYELVMLVDKRKINIVVIIICSGLCNIGNNFVVLVCCIFISMSLVIGMCGKKK